MNTTQLLNDIEQLPPEAQHQIEDFIAFIKTRYQSTTKTKLSEEEFVGMWSNRPEMQDSASHGLLIPDALIASTALYLNMNLATKNQRDYRFIENLKLLPY
jgi:predicted nucleic acid-binding protein